MDRRILVVVVLIIIVAGVGYFLAKGPLKLGKTTSNTDSSTGGNSLLKDSTPLGPKDAKFDSTAVNAGRTISKHQIILKSKFEPETITVDSGETVTWTNESGLPASINSDPHPIHTDYGPLNNVGLLSNGESKSFTFDKPGTYGFHNHNNPEQKGKVIVQ